SNGWLIGSFTTTTPSYLFVTHDAGAHWQGQTLRPTFSHGRAAPAGLPRFFPTYGFNGTIDAEFVPDGPNNGYSTDVTYNTHNGGLTWQFSGPVQPVEVARLRLKLLARNKRIAQLEFVDKNHSWAVMLGNNLDAQLFQTTDGGQTWTIVQT